MLLLKTATPREAPTPAVPPPMEMAPETWITSESPLASTQRSSPALTSPSTAAVVWLSTMATAALPPRVFDPPPAKPAATEMIRSSAMASTLISSWARTVAPRAICARVFFTIVTTSPAPPRALPPPADRAPEKSTVLLAAAALTTTACCPWALALLALLALMSASPPRPQSSPPPQWW